ncbi:MAG: hypothetical protein DRQ55_01155 [Planctomycetota bacterium]|nr:MAG: hypothetical protein DRQ55_01155 [Planctomycetota bacterium]
MIALALQDTARSFFDLEAGSADLDIIGGWLVAFLTLCVFSFLYKDNPFYKFAEHLFVGAGTAFFALQYYQEGILEPLRDHIGDALEHQQAGELVQLGGYGVDAGIAIAARCFAVLLSIMLLSRLVKPGGWAPRWPLAIMVGVYAAIKLTGETQSKLVQQFRGMMKPLTSDTAMAWGDNWQNVEQTAAFYTFAQVVLLVGTVCALGHFVFTFRRTRFLGGVSRVGVVVLMITFGSMFGFTVLGRIALLIERVDSLGGLTGDGYQLAGTDGSVMSALTSPPVLTGTLIVLVLLLLKGRRGDGDAGSGSAA